MVSLETRTVGLHTWVHQIPDLVLRIERRRVEHIQGGEIGEHRRALGGCRGQISRQRDSPEVAGQSLGADGVDQTEEIRIRAHIAQPVEVELHLGFRRTGVTPGDASHKHPCGYCLSQAMFFDADLGAADQIECISEYQCILAADQAGHTKARQHHCLEKVVPVLQMQRRRLTCL